MAQVEVAEVEEDEERREKQAELEEREPEISDGEDMEGDGENSAAPSKGGSVNAATAQPARPEDRWRDLRIRTVSGAVLVGAFAAIIYGGHTYVGALVVFLQCMMFYELMQLFFKKFERQGNIRLFRSFQWYFLVVVMLFIYGNLLRDHFIHFPLLYTFINQYHTLTCYLLYMLGFAAFVVCLEKGLYKVQLTQFAWTHMSLLLVVAQSTLLFANVFEGLIWFLLPTSLIIFNDIAAYACGRAFGRTPLIGVSPKKTVEGFVGALILTCIFGFYFSAYLSQHKYFVCPKRTFLDPVDCEPSWVFQPKVYSLPEWIVGAFTQVGLSISTIEILPVQLHALSYALFGSLIGPFGGFFASAVKRALNVKDFGSSIPGHGGVVDRFDCQMIMASFGYFYHKAFLLYPSKQDWLLARFMSLDTDTQLTLFQDISQHLIQSGILTVGGAGP